MSEETDTYCRLCAEPTPRDQLIGPEEDVAISSNIVTKLQWINIDISSSDLLPNTICFSCFDLLERTWSFLHNAQIAQDKLSSIFVKKCAEDVEIIEEKTQGKASTVPGKPVDKNWEIFQELKTEIKLEINEKNVKKSDTNIVGADNEIPCSIKTEDDSDVDYNLLIETPHAFDSTDSDAPLEVTAKKKKLRKRKGTEELMEIQPVKSEHVIPIDFTPYSATWENIICRCAKCDAQCKSIESLQLHSLQIHERCCVFKCIDCKKVVNSFKAFVKHVRTHNIALQYCCEHCNKLFLEPSEVKLHRTKIHSGIYKLKCKNCGSCFDTTEELREHKMKYGTVYRKPKENCKQELEMDLKCSDCNKVFKSRSNLQQHKLVHTERSRNFSCHVCGKMFFTKGTLGTHMLTHEDAKRYKCDYCPLAFRARGNLISHISLHSGVKPFVCEQCGKSFRVKRHLKSHSIIHTDLMPYICEYCNKSFRFKTRLNLHLRQHTGAKPYKCIYCQRDFTNGSNFKKHMKRRHGIDTSRKKYNNVIQDKEENEIISKQS